MMWKSSYEHIIEPEYGSSDVKYSLYNFHREADLEYMTELITASEGSVAILAGKPGSGRSYFIEAARHRAELKGCRATILRLDPDGYDPDHRSLIEDIEHLIEKRREHNEIVNQEVASGLRGLLQGLEKTFFKSTLLSFLLNFDQPVQRLATLLGPDPHRHSGPRYSDHEILGSSQSCHLSGLTSLHFFRIYQGPSVLANHIITID